MSVEDTDARRLRLADAEAADEAASAPRQAPAPGAAMPVEQERLYALGIDAYRLAGALLQAAPKPAFSLDGVTGRIAIDADRHFTRTLIPAGFDAGRAVALQSAP